MDKGAVTGVVKGMDKKFMRKLAIWAVVVEAIKGCLRLGARSTLSKLPKGVTLGEAQTRLEVLLKQAYNQGR
jgi:hypothetical protein